MEHYQPPPSSTSSSLFQLNLDATNGYTLRSAGSWARVMAVVGIIMALLFIGIGIMVQSAFSSGRYYRNQDFGGNSKIMGDVGMIMYIIIGLIYLISSLFALNFANRISRALKANDQASLSGGFAGLRNFFAFWAILMIICLLFLLIGFAGIIAQGGN